MVPIDPLARLSATIQAQLNAQRAGQAAASATRATLRPTGSKISSTTDKDGASGEVSHRPPHDQALLERVRRISLSDPDAERTAFRLFLESVVTEAFGERLRDDAGFAPLIDRILARLQEDDELRQAMASAGAVLLKRSAATAR